MSAAAPRSANAMIMAHLYRIQRLLLSKSSKTVLIAVFFIGLAVIVGHIYSVFLNFKGGKGVATTVGVFLACAPFSLIIAGIACLAVMWRSGYISAGSLTLIGLKGSVSFRCGTPGTSSPALTASTRRRGIIRPTRAARPRPETT